MSFDLDKPAHHLLPSWIMLGAAVTIVRLLSPLLWLWLVFGIGGHLRWDCQWWTIPYVATSAVGLIGCIVWCVHSPAWPKGDPS